MSFVVRVCAGVAMIVGFCILLNTKHIYVAALVLLVQIFSFKEMVRVEHESVSKDGALWGFKSLHWYILLVSYHYQYAQTIVLYFREYLPEDLFNVLYLQHNWHSFVLYVVGFCGFVFSLRNKNLHQQFTHLAWSLMVVLLVVIQSHGIIHNIYEGLIWFVLPCSIVICNDIWAYFIGRLLGRRLIDRPLTELSPNKTWEGFIGSFFVSILFTIFAAQYLQSSEWFVCPEHELRIHGGCNIPPVFVPTTMHLHSALPDLYLSQFQLHSIAIALFASLIAPFGGFFASAVKRTYKAKDFDDFIPGHGGMTDRMDCQYLMGLFVTVYYLTFVKEVPTQLDVAMQFIDNLSLTDRHAVLERLLAETLH